MDKEAGANYFLGFFVLFLRLRSGQSGPGTNTVICDIEAGLCETQTVLERAEPSTEHHFLSERQASAAGTRKSVLIIEWIRQTRTHTDSSSSCPAGYESIEPLQGTECLNTNATSCLSCECSPVVFQGWSGRLGALLVHSWLQYMPLVRACNE